MLPFAVWERQEILPTTAPTTAPKQWQSIVDSVEQSAHWIGHEKQKQQVARFRALSNVVDLVTGRFDAQLP